MSKSSEIRYLKKYSFIKPSYPTIEELYEFIVKESDLYDISEHKKELFLKLKINEATGFVLTYNMIKHKTTLMDFTINDNGLIEIIIVDNCIEYKKRRYKFKTSDSLQEGDDILFHKNIQNYQFYIICIEAKKGKDN
jgi:hypothetical protein